MKAYFVSALALLVLIPAISAVPPPPPPAVNRQIPIKLRVKAPGKVIFDGTILTRGHNVTTASGCTHHCDGTNNNQHPTPGATPTSALADAARRAHFSFDGTYFAQFDDFFISEIGGVAGDANHFWLIKHNGVVTQVGGCQEQLSPHDRVSFTFVKFNES